jgi:hypothetical protein
MLLILSRVLFIQSDIMLGVFMLSDAMMLGSVELCCMLSMHSGVLYIFSTVMLGVAMLSVFMLSVAYAACC